MSPVSPGQLCMRAFSSRGFPALCTHGRLSSHPKTRDVMSCMLTSLPARQSHDAQLGSGSLKLSCKGLTPCSAGSSWAVRLVSLAFMFFSLVISASFTANLTSQLTVRLLTSESFTLRVRLALPEVNLMSACSAR